MRSITLTLKHQNGAERTLCIENFFLVLIDHIGNLAIKDFGDVEDGYFLPKEKRELFSRLRRFATEISSEPPKKSLSLRDRITIGSLFQVLLDFGSPRNKAAIELHNWIYKNKFANNQIQRPYDAIINFHKQYLKNNLVITEYISWTGRDDKLEQLFLPTIWRHTILPLYRRHGNFCPSDEDVKSAYTEFKKVCAKSRLKNYIMVNPHFEVQV